MPFTFGPDGVICDHETNDTAEFTPPTLIALYRENYLFYPKQQLAYSKGTLIPIYMYIPTKCEIRLDLFLYLAIRGHGHGHF